MKLTMAYSERHTGLTIGERVIWMSDEGPEAGAVRWLGTLTGRNKNGYIAGIEFDNPVGSGTGVYKSRRLFTTKRNHASLVPVSGLITEKDFQNPPLIEQSYTNKTEITNKVALNSN